MKIIRTMALFLALFTASAAAAQEAPKKHWAVLNKEGPAWNRLAEFRHLAGEHHRIYRELADKGIIVAGGRVTTESGEPVFGMSVFREDVDRAGVRAILENDPIVKAGVLALEFLEWHIQMGALRETPDPAAAR